MKIFNILLLMLLLLSSSDALEHSKVKLNNTTTLQQQNQKTELTTYETGHPYENYIDETYELSIPGASELTVTVTGETEEGPFPEVGYDNIFITDSTGNETIHSGVLNEEFTVPGDHITVHFVSDGTEVRDGVVVHISSDTPPVAPPTPTLPPPLPGPTDTYETAHPYANYTNETQELSIPGASELTVTITGEIEEGPFPEVGYDNISIIDSTGRETIHSGVLNVLPYQVITLLYILLVMVLKFVMVSWCIFQVIQ